MVNGFGIIPYITFLKLQITITSFQLKSYSSKCSFLDNESIEHHRKYPGRRLTRGLFKSQKGIIINADVNGAYNILKKAFLNAVDADRIEDAGLHPTRWSLASATSKLMTSCE